MLKIHHCFITIEKRGEVPKCISKHLSLYGFHLGVLTLSPYGTYLGVLIIISYVISNWWKVKQLAFLLCPFSSFWKSFFAMHFIGTYTKIFSTYIQFLSSVPSCAMHDHINPSLLCLIFLLHFFSFGWYTKKFPLDVKRQKVAWFLP